MAEHVPRKKQKTIFASLNLPPKNTQVITVPTKVKSTLKTNPKQHKDYSSSSRTVTPVTVEKWKSELVEYNVAEWLQYSVDSNGKVANMKCKFCITYKDAIKDLPNFSDIFIIGSTNYKKSTVEEHATKCKPHLKAYKLFLSSKGISIEDAAKSLSVAVPNNTNIVAGIATMDKKDLEKTKLKFDVSYFIAKKRLSMKTYPDLLVLEKKHGVDMGPAYNNEKQCGTFIDYISEDIKNRLIKDLLKAKFFSILCDGSTDNAVVENEVTYALYFDPAPANSDSVQVKLTFLGMNSLEDQNAKGIASSLLENMDSLGMEDPTKKLIGFTSDGASVNRGNKESVKMILREFSEWMVFIWCIAHRLELALKDALSGTVFDDIDEMILRIYYLYQKAPKKLRELRKLHEAYAGVMEYEEGGVKPKKASGTRWISHKLDAMKICLDKWGLYM